MVHQSIVETSWRKGDLDCERKGEQEGAGTYGKICVGYVFVQRACVWKEGRAVHRMNGHYTAVTADWQRELAGP